MQNIKDNTVKGQSDTVFLSKLKRKLPEYFTENEEFNLEKFKFELNKHNIRKLDEVYQLDFVGKQAAIQQVKKSPPVKIIPDEEHNKNEGKDSENIFFTGDNLDALRYLQNTYQSKIDVIYIDPPYNTGSGNFIYQDKSSHSEWLAFMYPRLILAKNLLSDNGIIFISISDQELADLKIIMNEIFGETHFLGSIAWESKTKSQNTITAYDRLQPKVEYILTYAKDYHVHFNLETIEEKSYPYRDQKGFYRKYQLEEMAADGVRGRTTMIFPILGLYPRKGKQWKLGKQKIANYIARNDLRIENGKVIIKVRPTDERSKKMKPFWGFYPKAIGTAESAKKDLNKLFGFREVFPTVKPVNLIKSLIKHASTKNSIILDFFAGSSTTADAVMQLNAEDGGNRKFIMVQLPEKTYFLNKKNQEIPTKGGKFAYRAGFKSIDEISRKRIVYAAKQLKNNSKLALPEDFDGSFKHYYVEKRSL